MSEALTVKGTLGSRTQLEVFLVNVKCVYIQLPPKFGTTIWAEVRKFLGVMIKMKMNITGFKSFVNFKNCVYTIKDIIMLDFSTAYKTLKVRS